MCYCQPLDVTYYRVWDMSKAHIKLPTKLLLSLPEIMKGLIVYMSIYCTQN